jgi:hypothetical protein
MNRIYQGDCLEILELFAGTKSIGKVAESRGHKVFSVDVVPEFDCSLTKNILDVATDDIPFVPDVIWASPPCTYFSVASIGTHWNKDHTPKTKEALLGVEIIKKTIDLIKSFQEQNPNLIWFIENPRGKLRKLGLIPSGYRDTVTYCQYGDIRMKPTDIWTNCVSWKPKPMCKNGDTCHEPAPRGSKTGTQGLKGNKERSKIPTMLCEEIIISCEKDKYALFEANLQYAQK